MLVLSHQGLKNEIRRFSHDLEKWFCKCLLFVLSAHVWKDQNMALPFPAKENPDMEKALFDWPIVLQNVIKAKYWLISRNFLVLKFFQPKAMHVCIFSINQSNRPISVHLLFLFCSCVFISRSYKNHSILFFRPWWDKTSMIHSLCIAPNKILDDTT